MEEDIKGFQIQEEDQRGGGFSKQNQNQNSQQHHRQPPPQQPQKCPRCESLNTKFCYYNNYSLSQPRYFCKTCRRYWTQGGTLRNVPVGGGCRKGKRLKRSSSPSPSHQPNQMISLPSTDGVIDSSRYKSNDTSTASLLPPPFTFPGGGFLSSLGVGGGGIQSFNGEFGGSNLALLQGFSHHHHHPSYLPQHQHLQLQQQQQQQNLQFHHIPTTTHVFNMGGSRESLEENDGTEPNRPSTPHHQEWSQSPVMTSEAGYWSSNNNTNSDNTNTVSTSTTAATTTNSVGSLNLNQTHHWGDLPGFGAPPSNSSSSPSFL